MSLNTRIIPLICGLAAADIIWAQTTQGFIAGTVLEADSKKPLSRAVVRYVRREDEAIADQGETHTNSQGFFAFSFLSPGVYQVRVCALDCNTLTGFQPQEIYGLELFVAARLEVNFALRKLTDVWKEGIQQGLYQDSTTAILHYYASDVAELRSAYIQLVPYLSSQMGATVSYVVDPASIANLPLNGRDVYTALVLQPGVTADTGTARGLGISVNGQRPTASNYMLDGVDNNNALVTGPLTLLVPETMQEYRISTSSWSAEYGGTAGFLANATTRAGGAAWHGVTYFNLKNDALSANTFQNNAHGLARTPFKEDQYGFQAGGPVWRQKLFFSAGMDAYRSRSYEAPEDVNVPSPLACATQFCQHGGAADILSQSFPTPASDPGNGTITTLKGIRPTVSVNRYLGLARADYTAGRRHFMLRTAISRFDWPDFIWNPYPQFTSGLTQPFSGVAFDYIDSIGANLTQDLRAGWSRNTTRWDRPYPDVPTLVVEDPRVNPLYLPGSQLFYGLRASYRNYQLNDSWSWLRGRHIVKFGGGFLLRNLDSTIGTDAEVTFANVNSFFFDEPNGYSAGVDRTSAQLKQPIYGRSYRNTQFSFYGEDTWRLGHLSLNVGLRYENFGVPVNTGVVKDTLVQLGTGTSFPERIHTATLSVPRPGDQKLWSADNKDFAPRFGFAWDPGGVAPLLRGGYGIFFDRPFDNLWDTQANSVLVPGAPFECSGFQCSNYLSGPEAMLPLFQGQKFAKTFPLLTLIDPKLRSGYAQSYFFGLQKHLSDSWEVEVNTLGALGRRLVTTDVVNRPGDPWYNANLQAEIQWRSNQGVSNYNALAVVARYRSRRGTLQAAYTWSHSIDNQSDPLAGDYFDLYFTNITATNPSSTQAAFTQEFNSHGDRASSDFDQRQNLVFYSWWELPSARPTGVLGALTREWHFSQMAAFRAGFPYSVRSAATGSLLNQRSDIVLPNQIWASAGTPAAAGSVAVLNRAAFADPAFGVVGNSGRNAFRGPGLWNIDLSVSRSFPLPFLGESTRALLRADFYNAFNHANLNNPDSLYCPNPTACPEFGQASYGRVGYNTGFPALTPLNETPRQIQIIVKVEF